MTHQAWLLPALPFVAAVLGLLAGRRLPGGPATAAVGGTLVASLASVILVASAEGHPGSVHTSAVAWTPTGGMTLHVGTRVDGLAAVVAVMVCAVALLVQVYSVAYMAGDPRYSVYAAEVSLFTAAMLLVVLASDLLELVIGWEVMGLCSYLLIGHYWQTEGARAAAVKAFVTTRLGDSGFLIGVIVLGLGAHSFEIGDVVHRLGQLSHPAVVAGTLLLLAGVVGKSAQFPLHVWLPDAMAGPSPISALIHAATMVAGGIFVVARLYPVFLAAPVALTVLGILACVTMLGAALIALVEDDLKRVLAWSTVSQLAYMASGLAVRGWTASVYHLLSHAGYKALLFLAAGSVLRSVGSNRMSDMGGLYRAMPWTFATAAVGAAGLVGLPPLAGSFSKDGILAAAAERGGGLGTAVSTVGTVTAVVTAAYVTRAMLRTFFGRHRGPDPHRLHESPIWMTAPLVVLAVSVVGLGAPVLPGRYGVRRWLDAPAGSRPLHVPVGGVVVTALLVLAAALTVWFAWRRNPAEDPARLLGRAAAPLAAGFGVDEAYRRFVVRPTFAMARVVLRLDARVVDAAVVGSGSTTRRGGGALRRLQSGNVQSYANVLVGGVVVVLFGIAVAVASG